jgi:hypothetical protein
MRNWRVNREKGYGVGETIDELWGGVQNNQPVLREMEVSTLLLYSTRMRRWTELVAEVITRTTHREKMQQKIRGYLISCFLAHIRTVQFGS